MQLEVFAPEMHHLKLQPWWLWTSLRTPVYAAAKAAAALTSPGSIDIAESPSSRDKVAACESWQPSWAPDPMKGTPRKQQAEAGEASQAAKRKRVSGLTLPAASIAASGGVAGTNHMAAAGQQGGPQQGPSPAGLQGLSVGGLSGLSFRQQMDSAGNGGVQKGKKKREGPSAKEEEDAVRGSFDPSHASDVSEEIQG